MTGIPFARRPTPGQLHDKAPFFRTSGVSEAHDASLAHGMTSAELAFYEEIGAVFSGSVDPERAFEAMMMGLQPPTDGDVPRCSTCGGVPLAFSHQSAPLCSCERG